MSAVTGDGAGIIVFCDVVRFSEKDSTEQLECIAFLDATFRSQLGALQLSPPPYLNCIGDGFMAVFPIGACDNLPLTCLNVCLALFEACYEYSRTRPSLAVRFGLHRGAYRHGVAVFGGNQVIGRGPNDAARVVHVADGHQIVVSEEFYREGDGETWTQRFSEPIDAFIKHDRSMRVRVFLGLDQEQTHVDVGLPQRIRLARAIGETIISDLDGLHDDIATYLGFRSSAARDRLAARLTIYLPTTEGLLDGSAFRVWWRNVDRTTASARHTINPPSGPIPRAFQDQLPVIVHRLPHPKQQHDKYVAAWTRSGVTPEHLATWSRRPRALLAIPFAAGTAQHVRGVLVTDTDDPLEIPPSTIRRLADGLQRWAMRDIAWKVLARKLC